jgi:hypothetical protein
MVIRMVLHIVKFVNGFPQRGGPKYYSTGQIMTGRGIHADNLLLKFGTYCQVSENVEPRNSLAERTRGAISIGNSGNLRGGQAFMCWKQCQQPEDTRAPAPQYSSIEALLVVNPSLPDRV